MSTWWLTKQTVHNSKSILTRFQIHCWWDLIVPLFCWLLSRQSTQWAKLWSISSPATRKLKYFWSLTFSIPKYSLWIDRVVRHICTVVFCRLTAGNIYGGLKRKNLRESESGRVMLQFLFCLMSKLPRFGLFQGIQVLSEYQSLPKE